MEEGTFETNLDLARVKQAVQVQARLLEAERPLQHGPVLLLEKQVSLEKGVQASKRWPKCRAILVEKLRAQIQAGIYEVNSRVLAEDILENDKHFFEE